MIQFVRWALAFALLVPLSLATPAATQPGVSPDKPPAPGTGTGKVFRPTSPTPTAPGTPVSELGNPLVEIAYREPADPQFAPIRERLMRRKVLEQLRVFLSPLKLPRKLVVQTEQCNGSRRPYQPGGSVTICYEYVARIEQLAPRNPQPGSLPPELMVVGAFIQTVLHEVSLAIFDVFDVPVWGRMEDAADKLAGFIMVQFGKEVAQKVIIGAASFFDASDRTWTGNDFASVDSPEAQRLFNYLCIAFGSDAGTFKFLVDQNLLPQRRAQRCAAEYFELQFAFRNTILPHIDQPLMRRIQAGDWLVLDDRQ